MGESLSSSVVQGAYFAQSIKVVGLIWQCCHLGRYAELPSPEFPINGTVGIKSDEIASRQLLHGEIKLQ